ncbi:MAG TPA: hypothetical protein PKD90_10725, partial [Phnomibacter sp.]|nr:hypothetical protein [Phnomibacter sp.]
WIGAAGFAALFTAFMVYRYQVQQEVLGHYELQPTGQQRQWLLSLAGNYARLLGRSLVMPMQSSLWFTIGSLVAVSVMAYCLLAITLRNKQWYWALFIVSMFGVALLPYITLGIDTHGVESERYLYLPSLYTCMALAYMLVHVKRQALRVGGTLAVLAYFIVALWQSSLRFREASYYVQQTFNYLAQPPAGSTLLFTHLPADCGGAVMLRLGLAEGIQWLHAHKNFKNIWVQNWQEYNQLKIAPVRKLQTGDYGQLKALKVYSALKNDTLMVKVSSDSVWHFEYSIQGLQITTPR